MAFKLEVWLLNWTATTAPSPASFASLRVLDWATIALHLLDVKPVLD